MRICPASLPAALLAAALGTTTFLPAQDVIDSSSPAIPSSAIPSRGVNETSVMPGSPFPYRVGVLTFRPHAAYSYTKSDGVRAGPGVTVDTGRHRFSVGSIMEIGRRWTADYTASWNRYTSDEFRNTVSHALSGSGAFGNDMWTANLDHASRWTDYVIIDTARQTKQETHNTAFQYARPLAPNLYGNLTLGQRLRYVDNGPNRYDWSVAPGVSYLLGPRLNTTGSFVIGYTENTESPNTRYFRPQVQVDWQATLKTSVSAFAGLERREFLAPGVPDRTSPVFGGSAVYHPSERTSLRVSGSRSVGSGYFANQFTETRVWTADVNQRLFQRLSLSAGVTWADVSYRATVVNLPIVRDDDRETRYLRLGTSFLRGGSVGIGYRRVENESTTPGFGFTSKQFTFDISYSY